VIALIMSFLYILIWLSFLYLIFFNNLSILMQNLASYFLFVVNMKIVLNNINNVRVRRRNSIFNLKITALFFRWLATIGQNIVCSSNDIYYIVLLNLFTLAVYRYRLKILIFNHSLSYFFTNFIKASLAGHNLEFLNFISIFITI
jgi:hypothetical protein